MTMDPALTTLLMQRRGANKALVPPIGVMPLVLWDARDRASIQLQSGGVVSRWKDIMRGVPLNDNGSTTRPVYAPDYNYFGGLPVVKFDGVNDTLQNAVAFSPAIAAAGTRPHWFCVFRFRGASGVLFAAFDSPATTFMPEVLRASDLMQGIGLTPSVTAATSPLAAQHVIEHFLSAAAGVVTISVDGADTAAGSGQANPTAVSKLTLGNYNNGTYGAVSIAAIGCYAAELTAQQRIDLRAYYAAAYPAPVTVFAPPPIGVTPLALWDARAGVETSAGVVTSWVDTVRGLPLYDNGSTSRPVFAADYNYFGGLPVVQFDGVNDTLLNTTISPALTASTRPHWFVVARYRGRVGCIMVSTNAAQTRTLPAISLTSNHSLAGSHDANIVTGADPFLAQHVFEHFLSAAAGVETLSSDGVDVTSGTGLTSPADVARLWLGSWGAGAVANQWAAVSIAAIGCYAAELTAQQRIDLRAYYAAAFPAPPPTPPDFLTDLRVWFDPAYCSVSLGKIASFTNRGNQGGTLSQATAGNRATLNAADARFGNKPALEAATAWYPMASLAPLTAAECFIVGAHTTDPPVDSGFMITSNQAAPGHMPYAPDGIVYGEFCTSVRKTCGDPVGIDFAAPWLANFWSALNDWGFRINRTTHFTTATNTVLGQATPSILTDNRGAVRYFVGSWAAYILCGAKQTPAQQAQLEAWVLSTFGV